MDNSWYRKLLAEPLVLVLLIVAAGGAWAFMEIADEVVEGSAHEWDRWAVLALRTPGEPSDPIGPRWFEELMRDFTALGGIGVLALITGCVVIYLVVGRRWNMAGLILVAVGGGLILSLAMKRGFDRPRPDLVPHKSHVYTRSFPSGHAMMAAATYLTLGVMLARLPGQRKLRVFWLALAVGLTLLVGFSRVYLGVHWPTDVLAGWAAGATWALACWVVVLILGRRAVKKAPPPTVK